VLVAVVAAGCYGRPNPTGISATDLATRLVQARAPMPSDMCGYWVPYSSGPADWTAGRTRSIASIPPAHGLVRGHLLRLERWPGDPDASIGLRFVVQSTHGSTGVRVGDEAVARWQLAWGGNADEQWQQRGVPLTLVDFSDQLEVLAAVTGGTFGPLLQATDDCEPFVLGDGAGVALRWSSAWSLDDAETEAAAHLSP
jgi:hypothetical protein